MRRTHNDLQDATEAGACGLAILLVQLFVGYTVVERSVKGTGFDYWLGSENDALFQNKARLEASGILRGDQNGVQGFGRGVPMAGRGGRIEAVTYKSSPSASRKESSLFSRQ